MNSQIKLEFDDQEIKEIEFNKVDSEAEKMLVEDETCINVEEEPENNLINQDIKLVLPDLTYIFYSCEEEKEAQMPNQSQYQEQLIKHEPSVDENQIENNLIDQEKKLVWLNLTYRVASEDVEEKEPVISIKQETIVNDNNTERIKCKL